MRWTSSISSGNVNGLLTVFFVLTITFCLVSAGIFKANTNIGMRVAYAKKSKDSSGGDSGSDGGGSKGGDSSGGSDNGCSSNGDSETGVDNNNPTTTEEQNPPPPIGEPTPTAIPSTPPPPPPPTCEQGSTAPECSGSTEIPDFFIDLFTDFSNYAKA
jgi:hypothetical protein